MTQPEQVDIPTTVVTGFLGAGKTTLVRALFAARTPGQRWAVVVNDFGDVGLDAAILGAEAGQGAVMVREVPGGCVCCTAGVGLRRGLVEIVRDVRPDRLIIEPSGLAMPAAILDLLRSPGLSRALTLRALIGVVDVRHVSDARYREHPTWQAQWQLADVLVGTHADLATPDALAAFQSAAAARWPAPLGVLLAEHGAIEPAWLDADPSPPEVARFRVASTGHPVEHAQLGLVFPRGWVFDADRLRDAMQALVRPGAALSGGAVRLKGLFRVPGGCLLVQGTADALTFTPFTWRRDSRVEVIAAAGGEINEAAVRDAVHGARRIDVSGV